MPSVSLGASHSADAKIIPQVPSFDMDSDVVGINEKNDYWRLLERGFLFSASGEPSGMLCNVPKNPRTVL